MWPENFSISDLGAAVSDIIVHVAAIHGDRLKIEEAIPNERDSLSVLIN